MKEGERTQTPHHVSPASSVIRKIMSSDQSRYKRNMQDNRQGILDPELHSPERALLGRASAIPFAHT